MCNFGHSYCLVFIEQRDERRERSTAERERERERDFALLKDPMGKKKEAENEQ